MSDWAEVARKIGDSRSDEESDDQSPPRNLRSTGVAGSHGHSERRAEDNSVPPHGDLLVNLHALVVRVGGGARAPLLDGSPHGRHVPNAYVSKPVLSESDVSE